ncbi:hypothetical protein SAMN05444921_10879 [Streptomyces wuyuanensis]|uniref:Uncharacterized protein n=1 Tax=Streptomyces wuyuanensis TaxID=1196353 RepID=A0A1G9T656_9ACTN|nr:hypothetical protein SAMN05444921_10879 [Streptomyces wuyuanensis]
MPRARGARRPPPAGPPCDGPRGRGRAIRSGPRSRPAGTGSPSHHRPASAGRSASTSAARSRYASRTRPSRARSKSAEGAEWELTSAATSSTVPATESGAGSGARAAGTGAGPLRRARSPVWPDPGARRTPRPRMPGAWDSTGPRNPPVPSSDPRPGRHRPTRPDRYEGPPASAPAPESRCPRDRTPPPPPEAVRPPVPDHVAQPCRAAPVGPGPASSRHGRAPLRTPWRVERTSGRRRRRAGPGPSVHGPPGTTDRRPPWDGPPPVVERWSVRACPHGGRPPIHACQRLPSRMTRATRAGSSFIGT